MNLRNFSSVAARRKALEADLGVDLPHMGSFTLNEAVAAMRNCENMIGVAQVPMGIAGPLKIDGREYYLPLATTEGALIASVSRGCKAISESGGARVSSHRIGATRGPVFRIETPEQNDRLFHYLKTQTDELQQVVKTTSNHLRLEHSSTRAVGKYRYIRFTFYTGDAMGMNMVTIATEKLVRVIEEKTGARCVALAGNYDLDKKPSFLNAIEHRGIEVWAEVVLPKNVLIHTLKTQASKLYEVWLAKCMIGSALAGSLGYNAQFANIIAALFLATGQDLGHVGEGSIGMTTTEVQGDDLFIEVYLPDLMVGTIGGGTGLATQQEALKILGVAGGNEGKNVQRFAEIVAAAVLAGEISLLASLSEGTLARAHERLARGTK